MAKLTGSQRKWLRGEAHGLKPVVRIGKNGLTEATLEEIDLALASHELIKVQAVVGREEKPEVAARIEEELGAEAVGQIGHMLVLYRRNRDPKKRKVELPR